MRQVRKPFGLGSLTAGVVSAMFAAGVQAGTVTSDGADVVINTHGGLSATTVDGEYKFKLGGRVMFDMDSFDGAYNVGMNKKNFQSEIRRARIEMSGTVKTDWHYAVGADLDEDKETGIDAAYVKYTGLDFMDVTAGKAKSPFGLEEITSSKWISTIERSMIWDVAGAGGKAKQIQLHGTAADQFTWAVAGFDKGKDSADSGSSIIGYGGRLTWSPIHEKDHVVHLGLAYSDANPGGDVEAGSLSSRGSVHTAEKFTLFKPVDFGTDDYPNVADDTTLGLEGAYLMGPFSLQGEYIMREVDLKRVSPNGTLAATDASSVDVDAYYLQATYALTGESRTYKWKSGKFDKLKPKLDTGAVELVAKYESIEVSDNMSGSKDRSADVFTLGVNWYANQNVKLMLNYLFLDTDEIFSAPGEKEDGNAFAARVQYAF